MPSSTPPAADIPSGGDGAAATSGPGVTISTDQEPRRAPVVEPEPGQQPVRELRRRLLEHQQRQRHNGSSPNDKDKKDKKDKDKDKTDKDQAKALVRP